MTNEMDFSAELRRFDWESFTAMWVVSYTVEELVDALSMTFVGRYDVEVVRRAAAKLVRRGVRLPSRPCGYGRFQWEGVTYFGGDA